MACSHCGGVLDVATDALPDGHLAYCLICHSKDLFVRKDFPQRLGILLVVIGFIASGIAWFYYKIALTFGILIATAGIDVLLYLFVGDALECYRCHALFRRVTIDDQHGAFNLETHERYRQLTARAAEGMPTGDENNS